MGGPTTKAALLELVGRMPNVEETLSMVLRLVDIPLLVAALDSDRIQLVSSVRSKFPLSRSIGHGVYCRCI